MNTEDFGESVINKLFEIKRENKKLKEKNKILSKLNRSLCEINDDLRTDMNDSFSEPVKEKVSIEIAPITFPSELYKKHAELLQYIEESDNTIPFTAATFVLVAIWILGVIVIVWGFQCG